MTASLFKDLASSGWHSSIMTTYSVDPAFYDGSVEYRLRTYGCENNILLADAVMLKRALNATPEAFKNAGRRYAVVPVQVAGCFHPKVHLRLGTDGARLIVGSANATAAGWGSNHEIVTAIDWRRKSDDPTVAAVGPLIRRSYDYLSHWLEEIPGDAIDFLRYGVMTDDMFFLIVMSRWAIARAYLASMDSHGNEGLTKILQAKVMEIYQASSRYGPLDGEAEHRFIAKLDERLGFSEAETTSLISNCRRFAAMAAGRTPLETDLGAGRARREGSLETRRRFTNMV